MECAITFHGLSRTVRAAPADDRQGSAKTSSSPRILIVEDEYFVALALE
jgi:hypothetical protein